MEIKDKVLNHFEAVSQDFSRIYNGEQDSIFYRLVDLLFRKQILQRRRELILSLSGNLKGKKVLDIGCGPGIYAIDLAKKGAEAVLGIDISTTMIQLAEENAERYGLAEVCKFKNMDFMETNFQNSFDIIIAAGIFDYIKEPKDFLLKIKTLMNEKAILSFPIKWTIMTPIRMLWLLKRGCPNFYYSKRYIQKMLNLYGIRILSIDRIGSFLVPGNYIVVCKRR